MPEDLGGRAVHDGAVAGQIGDPVGVLDHAFQAVFGEQDGHSEVVHQPGDRGEHLLGSRRVERGGRLVQDQYPGVRGQHRTDGDALLLAAGQLVQRAVAQVGETEQVEGLLDALAHHLRWNGQLLHPVGEFLLHRVGDEAGQRVLPHHPDHVGQFTRRVVRGVPAVDGDPAAQGAAGEVRHQTVHGAEQGRLADTRPADHQAEFALRDVQVDVAQDGGVTALVHHADPVESDHLLTSVVVRSGVVRTAVVRSDVPRWSAAAAGRGPGGLAGSGRRPGGGAIAPAAPASSRASTGTIGRLGQVSG